MKQEDPNFETINCHDVQSMLIEYFDGQIDARRSRQIKQHLEECAACSKEAAGIREMLALIAESDQQIPSPLLRENFSRQLAAETGLKHSASSFRIPPVWGRVAAAFLLLLGGIWIGSRLRTGNGQEMASEVGSLRKEVREMKEGLMLSLLDDESASRRIKAVSYADDLANPDQQVINALFNTLNNDKNVNVRLAALYSLARFSDNHAVRDSLVTALGRQNEPIIQIVLINLLAEKREIKAIGPMRAIISNKTTLPEVKDAAQTGLRKM